MPLLYGEKKLRVAPSGGIGIIAEARRGATSDRTVRIRGGIGITFNVISVHILKLSKAHAVNFTLNDVQSALPYST